MDWAHAADLGWGRSATLHGMQGVRGSYPLSCTTVRAIIRERDRDLLGQDQPLNMRRDPATASDLARGVTRFLTAIRR